MKLTPKAVSKWFNGESIPRRGTLGVSVSHRHVCILPAWRR
nr:hypothetical protein [Klebsiella pneumoniae]